MHNDIVVVFGQKGSGKTTFARSFIKNLKRKIILDSLGDDYGGGCVVRDVESLQEFYNRVWFLDDFCIIVRPVNNETANAAFRLARKTTNTWFVVEEADRYCNPHYINPDFDWLVSYGRHLPVSLVVVSRRPPEIHRNVTAAADLLVIHRMKEDGDIDALKKKINVKGINVLPNFY